MHSLVIHSYFNRILLTLLQNTFTDYATSTLFHCNILQFRGKTTASITVKTVPNNDPELQEPSENDGTRTQTQLNSN